MMTAHDLERLYHSDYRSWFYRQRSEMEKLDRMLEGVEDVDDRETYEQFAARVSYEAPLDLEALGVPAAFVKWQRAVEYLRQIALAERVAYLRRLFAITRKVAIAAYSERNEYRVPPAEIIAEIDLQIKHDMTRFADRYLPIALRMIRKRELDEIIAEARAQSSLQPTGASA